MFTRYGLSPLVHYHLRSTLSADHITLSITLFSEYKLCIVSLIVKSIKLCPFDATYAWRKEQCIFQHVPNVVKSQILLE